MEPTIKNQLINLITQGKECKATGSLPHFCGEHLMQWKADCCDFLSENYPDEPVTKVIMTWRGADSIYENTYIQVMIGLQELYEKLNY